MPSDDGNDGDDEVLRRVFVGGVRPSVTRDEIRKGFEVHGPIDDIQTGFPKYMAFVLYEDQKAAQDACEKGCIVDGREVTVAMSSARGYTEACRKREGMARSLRARPRPDDFRDLPPPPPPAPPGLGRALAARRGDLSPRRGGRQPSGRRSSSRSRSLRRTKRYRRKRRPRSRSNNASPRSRSSSAPSSFSRRPRSRSASRGKVEHPLSPDSQKSGKRSKRRSRSQSKRRSLSSTRGEPPRRPRSLSSKSGKSSSDELLDAKRPAKKPEEALASYVGEAAENKEAPKAEEKKAEETKLKVVTQAPAAESTAAPAAETNFKVVAQFPADGAKAAAEEQPKKDSKGSKEVAQQLLPALEALLLDT
mmetsp:Transcript_39804/g.91799  ORF Transcript_39804/g.91799 Transcript_39804/m.91799 type:complete len:363 (-) Transcript_39804:243-1331(-)